MARQIMRRKAADNVYLHKDFHGALSAGIAYLDERYGGEAVRLFLSNFASGFYAPLRRALLRDGLNALREHFEKLYRDEGAAVEIGGDADELLIRVPACPAVSHMRAHGYPVARLFHETTRTVNEAICRDTPFAAELLEYDEQTGRALQRFYRRNS